MVLSSSRALAILPQLGQLLSNLRTFHHFTGRSVIFHRAKFNPENSNCTTGMSSIADYLAKVDAEGQAADKTTPATSTDQLMDSIECPTSSIPKSYFQVKPKGRWTKREKTTIEPSKPADEQSTGEPRKKLKKVAILLGYSGYGYSGMQWNPGTETIESVLLAAMAKADMITKDYASDLQKLDFQRCARTDKGVSAAGQVVSIPLPVTPGVLVEEETFNTVVDKVNAELPSDIRLFGLRKTTRGFNSKNWCSARTYQYMMPSFGFAPLEEVVTYDYRIPLERIDRVNVLLAKYLGTNNFHNFTINVKSWQDTAKRYMREVSCGQPFVRDGIEFVIIKVKGQSFMMHQIRKMVGLVVAVMRGHVGADIFDRIFGPEKADIPKAPGLGLMLQAVHFDMYNEKFGIDGVHEVLEWPECELLVEKFKEDFIFPNMVRGEKEDKSMLEWLSHLPLHIFGHREHEPERAGGKTHTELGNAQYTIEKFREEAAASSSGDEAVDGFDSGKSKPPKKKLRASDVI